MNGLSKNKFQESMNPVRKFFRRNIIILTSICFISTQTFPPSLAYAKAHPVVNQKPKDVVPTQSFSGQESMGVDPARPKNSINNASSNNASLDFLGNGNPLVTVSDETPADHPSELFSRSFHILNSEGSGTIGVVMMDDGSARIRLDMKENGAVLRGEWSGVYDSTKKTVVWKIGEDEWTLHLRDNLNGIVMCENKVNSGQYTQRYYNENGVLTRYLMDHSGVTFPMRYEYDYLQAGERALVSKSLTLSASQARGAFDAQTRVFNQYDDQGRLLVMIRTYECGDARNIQAEVWDRQNASELRQSRFSFMPTANVLASVLDATDATVARLESLAAVKIEKVFKPEEDGSNIMRAALLQCLYHYKNQEGVFQPAYWIDLRFEYDGVIWIIRGEGADAPDHITDDVRIGPNQTWNGYQIRFGVYQNSEGSDRVGLTFQNDESVFHVAYPAEDAFQVNEMPYRLESQEGILTIVSGGIPMPDGSVQILDESGKVIRQIMNDAEGTELQFIYDAEDQLIRMTKTVADPAGGAPFKIIFNLLEGYATAFYEDGHRRIYRLEIEEHTVPPASRTGIHGGEAAADSDAGILLAAWMENLLGSTIRAAIGYKWSSLAIPPNATQDGVDANILDWTPDSQYEGYQIFRREFGQTDPGDWELAGISTNGFRFIDTRVDSSKAYVYWVRPFVDEGVPLDQWIQFDQTTNYDVPDLGLSAQDVLVMISIDSLGLVDIEEAVTDSNTANGKLDPITEEILRSYLGYDESSPDFLVDSDGDGIAANTQWHFRKNLATGKIEIPLGLYYAIRRGIPKENIVYLKGIPTYENYDDTGHAWNQEDFASTLLDPVVQHMQTNHLVSQIKSVVSAYGFPNRVDINRWGTVEGTPLYPGEVSLETLINVSLWKELSGAAIPGSSSVSYQRNSGHRFSRYLGDTGFLTTRIDACNAQLAKGMIDNAIWAEENYHFDDPNWVQQSSLNAFVDWRANNGQLGTQLDAKFYETARLFYTSGYFTGGQEDGPLSLDSLERFIGSHLGVSPDIGESFVDSAALLDQDGNGKLDQTFLAFTFYNLLQYQDFYEFARGAIALELDSYSGVSFRDNDAKPGNDLAHQPWVRGPWGANLVNRGVTATLGAVAEPFADGHAAPELFSHYLLKGYSFAEAGYLSTAVASTPWKMAYNGDPLYTPFHGVFSPCPEEDLLDSSGQKIGVRQYLRDAARNVNGVAAIRPYRDYDLEGRPIGELLPNGKQILYLSGGRTAVYETQTTANIVVQEPFSEYILDPATGRNRLTAGIEPNQAAKYLRICDVSGNILSESLIPVHYAPVSGTYHDRMQEMPDGSVRIYRTYQEAGRPSDVFDQHGLLLSLDASGQVTDAQLVQAVKIFHYRPDGRTVASIEIGYRVIGEVMQQYIESGEISHSVITEIRHRSNQTILGFEYDSDPNIFLKAVLRSQDGTILARVNLNEGTDHTYLVVMGEFTFQNIIIRTAPGCFEVLNFLQNYLEQCQNSRRAVMQYLTVIPDLSLRRTVEQAESEVPAMVSFSLELSNRDNWPNEIFWIFGAVGHETVRAFHFQPFVYQDSLEINSSYKSFQGYQVSLNGTLLIFDLSGTMRLEISQSLVREYRYDQNRLVGYVETDANGVRRIYSSDRHLVVENAAQGPKTIPVGFSDLGFSNLQDALLFASSGDTLLLAKGIYQLTDYEGIDYLTLDGLNLTFRGEAGAGDVIFEGLAGKRFASITGGEITFENMTFRNFKLNGEGGVSANGGVLNVKNSILHFNNTIFENNSGDFGGAIRAEDSLISIQRSIFRGNRAAGEGAIYVKNENSSRPSEVTIEETIFENNQAGYYGTGAVRVSGSNTRVRIVNCRFRNNRDGISNYGIGPQSPRGALTFGSTVTGEIIGTIFENNNSQNGNGGPFGSAEITVQE